MYLLDRVIISSSILIHPKGHVPNSFVYFYQDQITSDQLKYLADNERFDQGNLTRSEKISDDKSL